MNMIRLLSLFLAVLCICAPAGAYPKPDSFQEPGEWTLDVVFEKPMQVMLQLPGEDEPTRYWYIIITLTNNTGQDVGFYPKCELVTDTFEVLDSGVAEGMTIMQRLKIRHEGKYPFLQGIDFTERTILQGEDNAVDVAVIWPDFDEQANDVKFYISGLSNETEAIEHPTEVDELGNPVKVLLRKTLELHYQVGGDPEFRSEPRLKFLGRRWVMR